MERQLATIRRIKEIKAIPNADKIELAVIDNWQCVTAKENNFKQDDLVIYFEIDSWVPTEVAPFLTKSGHYPKEFEGVKGERLRTIKLRGELSQGMILPLETLFPYLSAQDALVLKTGDDVTDILNIKKWEKPLSAALAGQAKGYFPSFIRKTDQERLQNILHKLTPEQRNDSYEVTLKIDGSSCTFYHKDGEVGVCSRNLELKVNDENSGNAFIKMFHDLGMEQKLKDMGYNIAIQGELWGSVINGNWEGIADHRFNVFDIFDIDKQSYLNYADRRQLTKKLGLEDVPFKAVLPIRSMTDIDIFLFLADTESIHNKVAEGLVFKSIRNPDFSFKVINNKFLLAGGD